MYNRWQFIENWFSIYEHNILGWMCCWKCCHKVVTCFLVNVDEAATCLLRKKEKLEKRMFFCFFFFLVICTMKSRLCLFTYCHPQSTMTWVQRTWRISILNAFYRINSSLENCPYKDEHFCAIFHCTPNRLVPYVRGVLTWSFKL